MITIDTDDVLARFSVLTGLQDVEKYLPLCTDTAREIQSAERNTCGEDGYDALAAAAAALAFYRYTLARAASGAESFSAGDVKVTQSAGSTESALMLWKEAAAAAAPYLVDSGSFLFGRISK
ncbi:MAG: DUF4054 domain-containing protein [Oscillospiraceae bacterium]